MDTTDSGLYCAIVQTGEHKGLPCNNPTEINKVDCGQHATMSQSDEMEIESSTCVYKFTRGHYRGQTCGRPTVPSSQYCDMCLMKKKC